MEIGQKVYVVDYDYKKEQRITEYEIKKIGRKYIHAWRNNNEYTTKEYEIESFNGYAHRCKQ